MSVHQNLVLIPTYNEKENVERMIRKVFRWRFLLKFWLLTTIRRMELPQLLNKSFLNFLNGCIYWKGQGNKVLEKLIWPDSTGLWSVRMIIFLKWTVIFRTGRKIWNGSMRPVWNKMLRWLSGRVTFSGINVINWPLSDVLMSYLASVYVRAITRMKIMDTTAGFKCYHRKV